MVDARASGCVKANVVELWGPLWNACRRSLEHLWGEGFDHLEILRHAPVIRRLTDLAIDGDVSLLEAHLKAFAGNASALHLLFESLTELLACDERRRKSLSTIWPWVMQVALDAIGDGVLLRAERHWFGYAVSAILPVPNPRSSDSNIDATLEDRRRNWIQPEALAGLDERWLRPAAGEPKAADAVVKFARSASLEWQASTALILIEGIMGTSFNLFANRLFHLEDWLSGLRKEGMLAAGEVQSRYHRIVDGLAAAGDRGAVKLQQLDE